MRAGIAVVLLAGCSHPSATPSRQVGHVVGGKETRIAVEHLDVQFASRERRGVAAQAERRALPHAEPSARQRLVAEHGGCPRGDLMCFARAATAAAVRKPAVQSSTVLDATHKSAIRATWRAPAMQK